MRTLRKPPPRLLVGVSAVVLLVCTVLAVRGALTTGVTTDEPIHVMRLRNFFDTGWYALDWDFVDTHPGAEGTNTFVYAPVTMLLLHAWSVLLGGEGWGEVATTAHAYDVRHLGIVVLGLVGLAATAALARLLLGSWRWGLVAAACTAAVPMWTGHSMFNVKDVPVAAGYTVVTLGLALLVTRSIAGPWVRLLRVALLAAGVVLTLGTRPGMWPGVVAGAAVVVLGVLLASARCRAVVVALVDLLLGLVIAAAALVGIYPHLFGHPGRALSGTAEGSAGFRAGESIGPWYVPRHLVEEVPLLLVGFFAAGAVVGAIGWWTLRRSDPVASTRVGLVGVQAFLLPVSAVVLGSDLYHGLRQLLFFIPAAAVLMALGVAWWLERFERRGRHFALGVAAAALLLPVVDQVLVQPYQTTYVNLATDVLTAPFVDDGNRPGGDFWRASIPELLRGQPRDDHQLLCKADVDKATNIASPFADGTTAYSTGRSIDCRVDPTGPLLPLREAVPAVTQDGTFDAVFLKRTPANCSALDEVSRRRHGFRVVLTVLARCTVRPSVLDDPAMAPADLWPYAVDGWYQWARQPELTAPQRTAKLAFAPGTICRADGCSLVVEGEAPEDLAARVGGRRVEVVRTGTDRIAIAVPRSATADNVRVTFTRRSGEPLGMSMHGLAVVPAGQTVPVGGTQQ